MSDYPPGVTAREIYGAQCSQCGEHGCDCDDDGDTRTYRERIAEEMAEHDFDCCEND